MHFLTPEGRNAFLVAFLIMLGIGTFAFYHLVWVQLKYVNDRKKHKLNSQQQNITRRIHNQLRKFVDELGVLDFIEVKLNEFNHPDDLGVPFGVTVREGNHMILTVMVTLFHSGTSPVTVSYDGKSETYASADENVRIAIEDMKKYIRSYVGTRPFL